MRPGSSSRFEGMEPHAEPDPAKLLEQWMEWERGDTPPGRVMSNLKTGGLRILLEGLAGVLVKEGQGS
jgi:hypothetical protein